MHAVQLRTLAAAFALIVLALAGGAIYVATNVESLVNKWLDRARTRKDAAIIVI